MATGSHAVGYREERHDDGRNPAQWFCLVGGVLALVFGAAGFLANGTFGGATFGFDFNDGETINGDLFLGIEVNGWTNVVNIGLGALLLVGFLSRGLARAMAIAIGCVYIAIAILGFLDGNDVIGFMVTNTPGNSVYLAFGVIGVIAGLLSSSSDDVDTTREPYARERTAPAATERTRFVREDPVRTEDAVRVAPRDRHRD